MLFIYLNIYKVRLIVESLRFMETLANTILHYQSLIIIIQSNWRKRQDKVIQQQQKTDMELLFIYKKYIIFCN